MALNFPTRHALLVLSACANQPQLAAGEAEYIPSAGFDIARKLADAERVLSTAINTASEHPRYSAPTKLRSTAERDLCMIRKSRAAVRIWNDLLKSERHDPAFRSQAETCCNGGSDSHLQFYWHGTVVQQAIFRNSLWILLCISWGIEYGSLRKN